MRQAPEKKATALKARNVSEQNSQMPPVFMVLHVGKIDIGMASGPATGPVKVNNLEICFCMPAVSGTCRLFWEVQKFKLFLVWQDKNWNEKLLSSILMRSLMESESNFDGIGQLWLENIFNVHMTLLCFIPNFFHKIWMNWVSYLGTKDEEKLNKKGKEFSDNGRNYEESNGLKETGKER